MAETKFGSFEGLLEITEEGLRPIASILKEIILGNCCAMALFRLYRDFLRLQLYF